MSLVDRAGRAGRLTIGARDVACQTHSFIAREDCGRGLNGKFRRLATMVVATVKNSVKEDLESTGTLCSVSQGRELLNCR